jgi:hypothetical protein
LQWLQDPSEINGDNLNNIRREPSRHFRDKKREYKNIKNQKERDHQDDQDIGGWTILK